MKSFNDLLLIHRQLDAQFLEHQRALIRGNLVAALSHLEQYEKRLLDHIKDEERYCCRFLRYGLRRPR